MSDRLPFRINGNPFHGCGAVIHGSSRARSSALTSAPAAMRSRAARTIATASGLRPAAERQQRAPVQERADGDVAGLVDVHRADGGGAREIDQGLAGPAPAQQQVAERHQGARGVHRVGAQGARGDVERAPQDRLGLVPPSAPGQRQPARPQDGADVRMIGTEELLVLRQRPLRLTIRRGVVGPFEVDGGEVLVGAGRRPSWSPGSRRRCAVSP